MRTPRNLSGPAPCVYCRAEGQINYTVLRCNGCGAVACDTHLLDELCPDCWKVSAIEMARTKTDTSKLPTLDKPKRTRKPKGTPTEGWTDPHGTVVAESASTTAEAPKARRTRKPKVVAAEPVVNAKQLAHVTKRAARIAELRGTIANANTKLAHELDALRAELMPASAEKKARKPRKPKPIEDRTEPPVSE